MESDIRRESIPPPTDSLLASIIDSSDDAIVSKDLDGIITSWNKAAERIFGYTRDEAVGRSILMLIPPDRTPEEADILDKIRHGIRIEHFETIRRHKDGNLIEVSVTISPIRDSAGVVIGASKIARDVSDVRRKARAAILLASIVSSSDDAIISKNLEGIITSWNEGAERLFGYAPCEIIGQPILRLIPADRVEEEPKIIERLKRGERVDHFETVRVRKNGEQFPVSLTISPVRDASGVIVGASKIARDITDVKRMAEDRDRIAREREQLLESERAARAHAEHANRMKDEFLSTVSHELRTPLNAIVGWTDVLADGGENHQEVIQGVEIIRRNALMQAQLIEDLLDLGRISSGKMTLNVQSVDLAGIINEAVQSVQHSADMKMITIRTIIHDARGGLLGDAKRLQQVIWNLLTNAIKFTPKAGRVQVAVARTASHIQLSVSDNGAGIAPEFLPHVFDRFSQADASSTRKQGGLGIGLALVKQLVELHAGRVHAESEGVGQGSTFTVLLPIAVTRGYEKANPEPDVAVNDGSIPDLSGVRVLAVDDDRDSLEVIRRILRHRHADVTTAGSVEEALKALVTVRPDVILSDIGMPDYDGYDLIRRVRNLPGGAAIPAAALTALARPDDRMRAMKAGFQTHVAKPVAAAEIVAVVSSLANLRRASGREPKGAGLRA